MKIENCKLKISILTLFPEMFQSVFEFSILKKAREKKLMEINIINIRDFGIGKHKIVDDKPYGGGTGMILRVDVISEAIKHAKKKFLENLKIENSLNPDLIGSKLKIKQKVVLLSASGKPYNQQKANEYAKLDHLVLVCGHYEGVDERITKYIDEEISLCDSVYTGGEIPAMLITDSVTRLIPGVLKKEATQDESFSLTNPKGEICLEYPHYTKPAVFDNVSVPEVLLTGNHQKIHEWRIKQASEKTKKFRPDLLKKF